MAQGRSAKFCWMIEWIQTSRLSMKNSLSLQEEKVHMQLVLLTDHILISHNAFINLFWQVNSPTKLSTYC